MDRQHDRGILDHYRIRRVGDPDAHPGNRGDIRASVIPGCPVAVGDHVSGIGLADGQPDV